MASTLPEKRKKSNTISDPFRVVAIGASAGGLEAVTQVIKNLSVTSGMAYVLVQHLDPTHESMLTAILGKQTTMDVVEVTDHVKIKPNEVYIIPPGKEMEILDGHLSLIPRTARLNMPIDKFFVSLAEVRGENAVGIILSGAANDGTLGLKAIREAGGVTIVQDGSAKFQSMPKSAIAEGVVDMILSPTDIAKQLMRISKRAMSKEKDNSVEDEEKDADKTEADNGIEDIFNLLKKKSGVDFNFYKWASVNRRIQRRMVIQNLETFTEYHLYLKENAAEISILFDDLLINVSKFFREPDANAFVRSTIVPQILANKPKDEPIRMWVPACASGQEVYSLAMLLFEVIGVDKLRPNIQIFGSDLSEKCIKKARIGIYTKNEVTDISAERLDTFFDATDAGYRIKKPLRDICLFALHNILTDPPFARIDFISCCNFLIYLKSERQQKVLHTFHYALQPNSYLLLSKSETIGTSSNFFKPVETEAKINIFLKEFSERILLKNYPFADENVNKRNGTESKQKKNASGVLPLTQAVDNLLLSKYIPSSVVINTEMEILQFRGSTSIYLEPAQGSASFNLIKMVRAGLKVELRSAVYKAIRSGKPAKKENLQIVVHNSTYLCGIEVVPLSVVPDEKYFLILFTSFLIDATQKAAGGAVRKNKKEKELEKEIVALREDMSSIIEDREGAVEELQTANEEIISSNEELNSINEELQTSKEEMESTNEELTTINEQMHLRNDQLSELHDYTESIITTIAEAMIVLEKNLIVRSANKSFYDIFKTKPEETEGMYLFDLGNGQWQVPKLTELLFEIIPRHKQVHNFEVTHVFPTIGKKTMLLNAKLLVQKAHNQELIFIAIQDITSHVEATRIIKEREEWFHSMANNAPVMIWVTDVNQVCTFFNETWYAFTGCDPSSEKSVCWNNMVHKDDLANYIKIYKEAFDKKEPFSVEYRLKHNDGEFMWVLDQAKPTYNGTEFTGYIGTGTDIHDQKLLSEKKDEFLGLASHELKTPLTTVKAYLYLLNDILIAKDNGQAVAFLKKVSNSIDKLNQLILQLLDVTNLQNGKMALHITTFNFKDLLVETIEFIHVSSPKYTITVTGNAGMKVHADYERLQQVITNLLSNAVKYSPHAKEIEINVSYKKNELLFALTDHGMGISQNNLQHIFEKFYREEDKTVHYSGLGVGLYIAAEIIGRHNGRIWAESTFNKGSAFYFTIPVKPV